MCGGGSGNEQTPSSTNDKLPIIDHHHKLNHFHLTTQDRQLQNDLFTSFTPTTDEKCLRNPWSHHHSDLGLNHLSTSSEYMGAIGPTTVENTRKKWKMGIIPHHSSVSCNAKSNGELSSPVGTGNSDGFLGNKLMVKHSADLKEFRIKFGSSPTLMSCPRNTSNQSTQQTSSRLDAVPFQYRRGYTNLNDVCLSSSTSDLDGFTETSISSNQHHQDQVVYNNGDHRIHHRDGRSVDIEGLSTNNPDSMLRNRKHRLDYVRSYENLDINNQLVGLTDDQGGGEASGYNNDSRYTHFDRTFGDDDWLDQPGRYDFSTNSCSTTAASAFQSNESLFNVHFDSFDDTILDIEKLTLFEPINPCSSVLAPPLPALNQEPTSSQSFSTTNQFNDSRLLIYETMLESIDAELRQCRHTLPSSEVLSKLTIDVDAGSKQLTEMDKGSLLLPPTKKHDKLRCAECNKRLGVIMVMHCHCNKTFCPKHRYAEAHNCSYDFKFQGKLQLERENPIVVATKLPKI